MYSVSNTNYSWGRFIKWSFVNCDSSAHYTFSTWQSSFSGRPQDSNPVLSIPTTSCLTSVNVSTTRYTFQYYSFVELHLLWIARFHLPFYGSFINKEYCLHTPGPVREREDSVCILMFVTYFSSRVWIFLSKPLHLGLLLNCCGHFWSTTW